MFVLNVGTVPNPNFRAPTWTRSGFEGLFGATWNLENSAVWSGELGGA